MSFDSAAANSPSYLAYVGSPVSGGQNVVARSAVDNNSGTGCSWSLLGTISSIISHSLYW